MAFKKTRPNLELDAETITMLTRISRSHTEPVRRVERAKILLGYYEGMSVSELARLLGTNRPKIERCIDKALQLGVEAALADLKRSGRPPRITDEAKAWLVNLACQRPLDRGYPHELWTTDLLARHARAHCLASGHPSLAQLNRGTVSKILRKNHIKPHKIRYYLESRDSEFETKMATILYVYRHVSLLTESGEDSQMAVISYDEKPGIQVLESTRPDTRPRPGKQRQIGRDSEYIRHGTMSVMAGIDLLSGHVHGQVVDRHRSREFIDFLKLLDGYYSPDKTIRIILDNHSIHTSKETRAYLKTIPNRFDFIFTPKHGSWLNLIESFFSKMTRSLLRHIRVKSKDELRDRIMTYLDDLNAEPIIFRWKYQPEDVSITGQHH
ncbi:MAG: IS630 family transposase [bacterium]